MIVVGILEPGCLGLLSNLVRSRSRLPEIIGSHGIQDLEKILHTFFRSFCHEDRADGIMRAEGFGVIQQLCGVLHAEVEVGTGRAQARVAQQIAKFGCGQLAQAGDLDLGVADLRDLFEGAGEDLWSGRRPRYKAGCPPEARDPPMPYGIGAGRRMRLRPEEKSGAEKQSSGLLCGRRNLLERQNRAIGLPNRNWSGDPSQGIRRTPNFGLAFRFECIRQ